MLPILSYYGKKQMRQIQEMLAGNYRAHWQYGSGKAYIRTSGPRACT